MELIKPWITKCTVCGQEYENGCGSTECCGALQYVISNGGVPVPEPREDIGSDTVKNRQCLDVIRKIRKAHL